MKEERKQIKLEEIKRDNVFQVPEDYFETLPGRVQLAIAERMQAPAAIGVFSSRLVYYAAACVAVLLVIWFSLNTNNPKKEATAEALLSEVSTSEMIDYLEKSEITTFDMVLTEEDQKEMLEEQLDNLDLEENFDLDLLYLEEYL